MENSIIPPPAVHPQLGMKRSELERFLSQSRVAVLSWTTLAGEVAATPIWFFYRDGVFLLHTNHPLAKTQAILKNERVALVIQDEVAPYRYVSVRGRARLRQEPQEALRLYEEQARAYLGRLGGYFFLRFRRRHASSDDEPGEDVIIEITPTKITAFNGSAAVNPVLLLAMRAVRFVGL